MPPSSQAPSPPSLLLVTLAAGTAPLADAQPGCPLLRSSPRLKLVNLSSVGSASNPIPLTWAGDPGLDFTWHGGATARKEDRGAPLLSGKAPSPFTTSSSRLPQELQNRGGEPGREGWGLRKVFGEASFEYLPLSGACSVRSGGRATRAGGGSRHSVILPEQT